MGLSTTDQHSHSLATLSALSSHLPAPQPTLHLTNHDPPPSPPLPTSLPALSQTSALQGSSLSKLLHDASDPTIMHTTSTFFHSAAPTKSPSLQSGSRRGHHAVDESRRGQEEALGAREGARAETGAGLEMAGISLGLGMDMMLPSFDDGDDERVTKGDSTASSAGGISPRGSSVEEEEGEKELSPRWNDYNSEKGAPPSRFTALPTPPLHPFDPTFSPPSPRAATSSLPSLSTPLHSFAPPSPPSPAPTPTPPRLPEGYILIPWIDSASELEDDSDDEYWTRLPTFNDGPGSPGWESRNSFADFPSPPPPASPSLRSRSLSLPIPVRDRPTMPTRTRSSPSNSLRGRASTPELSASHSHHRKRAHDSRSRSPKTRRRAVDPPSPSSSERSLPALSSPGGSVTSSSSSAGDSSSSDSDSEEEEFDSRFVSLPALRRTLHQQRSSTPSPSPSSRSLTPSPPNSLPLPLPLPSLTPRASKKPLFFAEQWRLYALGTANWRRTGEGYWSRDWAGGGRGWADLE